MRKRTTLALALILLTACCSAANGASKRRSVRSATPQWNHAWSRGAVFYEIFVRSFADSNGDGIGDFNGLIAKLDYLNDGNPATTTDLGIDGIWLMPVFQSPSYHGYDVTDYETIESDYGTNADFQRFLDEAHHRGIRVIVDLVMNHTSSEHPWFLDSASSPGSAKRDWYVWSATNPGWVQPWGGTYPTWYLRNGAYYYAVFWSGMPDVNYRNAEAKAEMFRIARHWLAQGVDGYRLDATRYLVETGPGPGQADTPETHQVLKELSSEVRRTKPEATLVAENTTDTRNLALYYGSTDVVEGGDEMPMNFNFPLASAVLESVKSGDAGRIRATLADMARLYPAGVIDAPFLTNHDQTRLATVLDNSAPRIRNAAAILLTLPGAPFLYYGEEVGMQNGPTSADESKRTPMPWTPEGGFTTGTPWIAFAPGLGANNVAVQTDDPRSLLSHYRNWIAVRKASSALRTGDLTLLDTDARLLAFTRASSAERVLVVHNLSDATVTAAIPVQGSLEPILVNEGVSATTTLTMPPRTSAVFRVR